MRILGLIPARGGSKRLPGKNLREINGHSLVEWAVRSAQESEALAEVVVSTEDEQIRLAAFLAGAKVRERPMRLALDDTPSIEVVRDAVAAFPGFDAVVLLQPTSPLRTGADIRTAAELLIETRGQAVVSVTETRHPEVYTINPLQRLRPLDEIRAYSRKIVVPNGAIFGLSTEALAEGLDWWTCTTCYGFEMPAARSVDIDTLADLELARTIMKPDGPPADWAGFNERKGVDGITREVS